MRLVEHFITFYNEFNKINNTGIRMLDSIYHMTSTLLCNHLILIFGIKTLGFCHLLDGVVKSFIS